MSFVQPLASSVSYVANGAAITVAQLLSSYPANATQSGKYAVVTDLYNNGSGSGVNEIVRCRYDVLNAAYRWVPQRQEYNRSLAATGGTVTLSPLVHAPTLIFNGTLLSGLTVTPSPANAWVGMRFRVIQNSVLGLFVTTVTGLIGSNITLLGNAEKVMEYTAAGWREMTS